MSVKSCLTWFRVIPGIGVQPISGIVDEDGDQFVPEIVQCLHGSNVFNTLYYNGSGVYNTTAMDWNFQRMSDDATAYYASAELPQFAAKIVSSAGGTGANGGFASLEANAFFGGDIYRWGRFQNAALGSIELNLTKNDNYFATDVLCLCLAGVETEARVDALLNGARSAPAVAQVAGLYVGPWAGISAAGPIATGAGGGPMGCGWATRDTNGYASMRMFQSAGNSRTRGDVAYQIAESAAPYADGFPLVTWTGANTWTVTGRATGSSALAIGGANVRMASGVIQQPTAPGNQVVVTGIKGRWIVLTGVGAAGIPAGTGLNDWAEVCVGWSDCRNQGSFWGGESRIGNVLPLLGASFSSHTSILRFTTTGPNSGSTTFPNVATFVEADPTGSFTINWSSVDGIARDINWFVLGEDADTPPPPIPTSNPMCLVPLPAPVLTR